MLKGRDQEMPHGAQTGDFARNIRIPASPDGRKLLAKARGHASVVAPLSLNRNVRFRSPSGKMVTRPGLACSRQRDRLVIGSHFSHDAKPTTSVRQPTTFVRNEHGRKGSRGVQISPKTSWSPEKSSRRIPVALAWVDPEVRCQYSAQIWLLR